MPMSFCRILFQSCSCSDNEFSLTNQITSKTDITWTKHILKIMMRREIKKLLLRSLNQCPSCAVQGKILKWPFLLMCNELECKLQFPTVLNFYLEEVEVLTLWTSIKVRLPALIAASVWIAPLMAPPFGEGISRPKPLTTCIIYIRQYRMITLYFYGASELTITAQTQCLHVAQNGYMVASWSHVKLGIILKYLTNFVLYGNP